MTVKKLASSLLTGGGLRVSTWNMPTPKQELLEIRLPNASTFVSLRIANGASWKQVSDDIKAACGISVSHESLRQWYGIDVAA